MPLAPASREAAVQWAQTMLPHTPTLIRFRWRYQDERVKYAGRGSARIAPPDSMRFDYAGPLNLGSGAAVVIGDSVAWADPEKDFRSLVPAIPMLWAALGMARLPAENASVFGTEIVDSHTQRRRIVWQIEKYLAEDGGRPIIFHPRSVTCSYPQVKGITVGVNSPYNMWRMEDAWLDR